MDDKSFLVDGCCGSPCAIFKVLQLAVLCFSSMVKLTLIIGLTCLPHHVPSWRYVSLGPEFYFTSSMRSVGLNPSMDHTAIELTGSDRPGLLSELSVVLRHLKCNVVNAEVRIHNTCTEAVMQVTDEEKGSADTCSERLILDRKIFFAMCLKEATNPVWTKL